MGRIKAGYYDSNEIYARRLSGYLSKRKGLPFSIRLFTEKERFLDYIRRENPSHVLISEPDLQIVPVSYSGRCLILTEDERASPGARIYKYQAGEQIAKQLMSFLYEGKPDDRNLFEFDRKYIIGIYSPIRRCGKSQFSMAMAQTYGEDSPTLLLCFDDSCALTEEQMNTTKDTMSDLLFCYAEMREKLPERLPRALKRLGRFDFIYPADNMEDLYQISGEDWKSFINMIAVVGGYDTVILELGQPIKGIFDILECCNTVYMPVLKDRISQEKIAQLSRKMESLGLKELFLRLKAIVIPRDEEQGEEYFDKVIHGNKRKLADELKSGRADTAELWKEGHL